MLSLGSCLFQTVPPAGEPGSSGVFAGRDGSPLPRGSRAPLLRQTQTFKIGFYSTGLSDAVSMYSPRLGPAK